MANPILHNGQPSTLSIYETTALKTTTDTGNADNDTTNVGHTGSFEDGRRYMYVVNTSGSTLTAGNLLVAGAVVANHQNLAVAAGDGDAGQKDLQVTLGATAATANQYRNGYAVVTDGTGEARSYRVRSHPAASGSATLLLNLYDNIETTLDATSTVSLFLHPASNPQQSNTGSEESAVGVAEVDIANNRGGWVQTYGLSSVLTQGTPAVGTGVTISDTTAGAIGAKSTTAATLAVQQEVGVMASTGVDGEHQAVFLKIS